MEPALSAVTRASFPHDSARFAAESAGQDHAGGAHRLKLRYHPHKANQMAKAKMEAFEVGCPCCGALLKVDPETRAVIAHTPPARPKTFNDFEEAARAMREQEGRKESLFRQAVDAERNKADVLERKFQEAVKRAKDTPDTGKPLRDFDLD